MGMRLDLRFISVHYVSESMISQKDYVCIYTHMHIYTFE